jgi:hypothetical protein
MENLWWDHVREYNTVDEHLRVCAKALKAASPAAVQDLQRIIVDPEDEEVRIVQIIMTSNHQTQDDGQPPSPAIPGWQSATKCLEMILEDRGIIVQSRLTDTLSIFLGIFSVSSNFDCVLEALERLYYSNPLSDTSGTRIGLVLFLFFLWLSITAH